MTTPPMEPDWPRLWMDVSDVFHIKGRGTVITGRLEGGRQLQVGDIAVCDGMRWQVKMIQQFGAAMKAAEPGSEIGVLLSESLAPEMLRNRTIEFESKAGRRASPEFTVLAPKKKRWRR